MKEFHSIGIVLRKTCYRDHLYILKIFTKSEGLVDARVRSSARSKIKPASIQPWTLAEFYFKKTRRPEHLEIHDIHLLASPEFHHPVAGLFFAFVQELCLKTIPPHHPEEKKFHILHKYVVAETPHDKKISGRIFPQFLREWTEAMGIMPEKKTSRQQKYFCVSDGKFYPEIIAGIPMYDEKTSAMVHSLISEDQNIAVPTQWQTEFWLNYLSYHIPEVKNLKSVEVIRDIKFTFHEHT